jgi:hypothetical protein
LFGEVVPAALDGRPSVGCRRGGHHRDRRRPSPARKRLKRSAGRELKSQAVSAQRAPSISIHEFVASEFKLPRGRFFFQNIQIGQSNYLSTLQAADTHGSTDAPKCARQRGPFRTQEYLVQLALEMDLPCFLKARALVRLRVFSYCGCGHTRLDRRLPRSRRTLCQGGFVW